MVRAITVSGTVVDAETGQPINRVIVEGHELNSQTTRKTVTITGPDGSFTFDNVPSGSSIIASHRGYRGEDGNDTVSVTVPFEAPASSFVLKLVPLGVITGRVVNQDGEPLQGLTVAALTRYVNQGRAVWHEYATMRTNDLGEYRLWHLTPGKYVVKVAGRRMMSVGIGELPATTDADESYGPVYSTNARSLNESQPVIVKPGTSHRADFTVFPQKSFRIRGVLRNHFPNGRSDVSLYRDGDLMGNRVLISASSGMFEIRDVLPGSYVLRASTGSDISPREGRTEVVVKDRDVTDVAVNLSDGHDVVVKVAGWQQGENRRGLVPVVHIIPLGPDGGDARTAGGRDERDDNNGTTTFKHVSPGRYALVVDLETEFCVASIRSDSQDVLRSGFTVTEAGAPPLEVTLTKSCGTALVTFDNCAKGCRLIVAGRSDPAAAPWAIRNAYAGKNQVVLPPGEYEVYGFPHDDEVEYLNPAVMLELSKYATPMSLRPNGTTEISAPVMDRKKIGTTQ